MIKFMANGQDKNILGLAITEENVKRLKEGQPIIINGQEVGIDGLDILLMYGKDTRTIRHKLKDFIGEDTELRVGLQHEKPGN